MADAGILPSVSLLCSLPKKKAVSLGCARRSLSVPACTYLQGQGPRAGQGEGTLPVWQPFPELRSQDPLRSLTNDGGPSRTLVRACYPIDNYCVRN